ncbi:MAG: fatty acid desaturase [Proteobacteria bacterium]|nr:fatty acid desaturase [Pseudomonadota bacterium]
MRESLLQIATSLGGFVAVCVAMYVTAGISFWIVLALMPLAAGFLVRTFIVQHDCGHGAFFRSKRWNDVLGVVCSLVTLAPYPSWRRQHAGHHGVWNNLDRRDTGADIYSSCLTVEEYRQLSPWGRRWYRVSRNPIVANLLIPPLVFLVLYRLPFDMPVGWRGERRAVYLTDIALIALFCGLGLALGFGRVIGIQLPVMAMAAIIGVWLFTVQHRSEWTVWARQKDWDAVTASLKGSTYLRLPRILQWFTGNIGLHHIHHLNPKIPNYRLEGCHEALTDLQEVPVLTLGSAFKAMFFVLWDERRQRLVTFRAESRSRLLPDPV